MASLIRRPAVSRVANYEMEVGVKDVSFKP
jgi:hypothetical protein